MIAPVPRLSPTLVTLVIFLAAFGLCALRFPVVLSGRVMGDLLTDSAVLGIAAVGMTVVIISGGIDLSVGGVAAFSAMLVAVAIERWGLPLPAAFAVAIVFAAAFGACVGAGVHLLRTPPFILTLAAMFLLRGACFLLSKDSIPIRSPDFETVANWALPLSGGFSLSLVALLMLGSFLAGGLLLHRTAWGTTAFAMGGDARSAELMGLPVARTTVSIYAFSALCAGLAGIALSLYTGAGYPLAAQGVELDAIAAVVIGGVLLSGGAGRMAGSFLGVLILSLIFLFITFDGRISSWWTRISIGILLFGFIALQKLMGNLAAREARR
jgi:ribose/xylose/arabinose/galactoside ABC-type transport system permease subunit